MANLWDILKKTLVILTLVSVSIGIIESIFSHVDNQDFTYEKNSYQISDNMSVAVITLRNGGSDTANNVELNINAKGEIKNIEPRKGRLGEQIKESGSFKDYPKIEYFDENTTSKITIPQVSKKMFYQVSVLVNKDKGDPIDSLLINSDNIIPKEYEKNENIFVKFIRFFTATMISLILGILWMKHSKIIEFKKKF